MLEFHFKHNYMLWSLQSKRYLANVWQTKGETRCSWLSKLNHSNWNRSAVTKKGPQSHSCGSVFYHHIHLALFHHAGQAGARALIMAGLTKHPWFQRPLPVDNTWKEVINPFKGKQGHRLISQALIDVWKPYCMTALIQKIAPRCSC